MNIVYQGAFLREGLQALGHNLITLPLSDDEDINSMLDGVSADIDLVLLEIGILTVIPKNIHKCKHILAAYCIDSPINEFWLSELCRIFDYVFVDQKSTMLHFKDKNIYSQWMPLCVTSSDFREYNEKKEYDIVFVGNTSQHRLKRNNLLNLLKKYFSVTVVQNISSSQMLTVFSQAKIVLNENLFSGLTLRVFQGLASGALVLTEEGGVGVEDYFRDREHLVCYNPNNIISLFDNILANYDSYAHIADNGQSACRQYHTSAARAHTLLTAIDRKRTISERHDEATRKYFETKARYLLKMRFGGIVNRVISDFVSLTDAQPPVVAAQALLELGNIAARNDELEKAESLYTRALHLHNDVYGNLRLALLYITKGILLQAKHAIALAALKVPKHLMVQGKHAIGLLSESSQPHELLFIIANIYFMCGNTFSLGFSKQFQDAFPDTALETASMAWKLEPLPVIMDFMLSCLKECGVEGELLPELVSALQKCRLSDEQILYAAELAQRYYDPDLAVRFIDSFKKTREDGRAGGF